LHLAHNIYIDTADNASIEVRLPMPLPHVTILMCARNGAPFIEEQLESLDRQSHGDWSILIADDRSSDATATIVDDWIAGAGAGRARCANVGGRGIAANYLELLARTGPEDGAIAFCDQDDIWLPHKLQRALERLAAVPRPDRPAAYACRSLVFHDRPDDARPSRAPRRLPAFGNAMVQNMLAGHALVINQAAAALLRDTVPAALAAGVPFHDWWAYLVLSGAGAQIVLDDEPGVLYRQHGANVLGDNRGLRAGLSRARMIAARRYRGWLDRNLAGLEACAGVLTPQSEAHLRRVVEWRARRGMPRLLQGPGQVGLYRQGMIDGAVLSVMARTGWM
jgi:glycosyltransferase involved in cell wall biosynthesis